MKREFPESRLSLILGRDAFDQLPKWHRWRDIARLAEFIVVNRPGYPGENEEEMPTRVVEIEIPPTDISATDIRRRLRAGEDVTGMLPPEVLSFIHENQLYV